MQNPYLPKLLSELRTYNLAKLRADIFAGITVGIVALPLAMAFAIATGLPPERGLFTAIVAGFLISLLGGSHVQIGGPTGAFVVIVASIVSQHGYAGLAVCTLIAGLILIAMGLCKLGALIRFIPFPVTTGFTSGIALTIFSTQIPDLLGLELYRIPPDFIAKWTLYCGSLANCHQETILVSLLTVATILGSRRFLPKWPAMLIGMATATLVVWWFNMDVTTIGSRFGDLPRLLPQPSLPHFTDIHVRELLQPALVVAMLAGIESLLSATVADGMTGGRHRPNAELIGQGLANIGSVLFGGIPATGAIARTATNIKSGARTPVAGLIHALTLALLLLLLAPAAKMIPLAALAGILVVVSYNMSEIHHFASILKGPRSDALVLVATFLLTVLVDLTVAVQVGVVLSALLFMRRMAAISNVQIITGDLRGDESLDEDPGAIIKLDVPDGVEVFEVNGPFFFGMVDRFHSAIRGLERSFPVLVIRTRNVLAVDATAIHVIRDLYRHLQKEGTQLVFSGVHTQPLIAFERAGLLQEIGPENFLGNIDDALNRARTILGLPQLPRREHAGPSITSPIGSRIINTACTEDEEDGKS